MPETAAVPTGSGALPPGSRIGVLGSGQLARMLAMAAARIGLTCHIYADTSGPAFDVAAAHTLAPYDDEAALRAFAGAVDAVTYEFENVPVATARWLMNWRPVLPGPEALEVTQDRVREKELARALGLSTVEFRAVGSAGEAHAAAEDLARMRPPVPGRPLGILKTRRFGYDGKGQALVSGPEAAAAAFDSLGGVPAILEAYLPFDGELSVLVVRGLDGASRTYDIPRNTHKGGILRTSTVPSGLAADTEAEARGLAQKIADRLGYVGVLAVELFLERTSGGGARLYVNEMAPRVHNSGHWTIDGCAVSQFENHMRAVAGWPLGDTARHSDVEMTNLIGREIEAWPELAGEAGAALHVYGKREAREGRKMGHVNRLRPKGGAHG